MLKLDGRSDADERILFDAIEEGWSIEDGDFSYFRFMCFRMVHKASDEQRDALDDEDVVRWFTRVLKDDPIFMVPLRRDDDE